MTFSTVANKLVCVQNSLSLNCSMFLKKDALSVRKRLLRCNIKKLNKELRDLSKELSLSENLLCTQLSTIEFYILTKYKTLHNKKLLQKSLCTQQKKLSSLTSDRKLPTFIPNENITDLTQYELSQKESDLRKACLYFSIQPHKFLNPKSLLHLRRFIVRFFSTLNPRKPKVR